MLSAGHNECDTEALLTYLFVLNVYMDKQAFYVGAYLQAMVMRIETILR